MNLLEKAKVITTPTAYSDGILHSVKPNNAENLLLQSNQFDTNWVTTNAPALTSGQSGYDGTNDAWKLEATTTGSSRSIHQIVSSSGVQVFSVYVKAGTTDWIRLNLSGIGNRYFDIGNGVVGGSGSINGFITDVGGGWYRCSVLGNGSSTAPYIFLASDNGNLAVNAGDNIYIQDAQLNKGLTADQYIETTDVTSPRADFTFTRNSSATRVGEDGYIQDVQIIGGELTQNGDFEQIGSELVTNGSFDTDSDWNKANATISGGKAIVNVVGGAFSYVYQSSIPYTSGKIYRVTLQVQGTSGYNIRFQDNTTNLGGFFQIITLDGTQQSFSYDFTANANSNVIQIARSTGSGDYSFSIDNVSVKEVGQNWTFGTGWSMGDGKAVYDDTANGDLRSQAFFLTATKKYRIKLSVSDLTSGTAFFALGSASSSNLVAYDYYDNGDYTFEVTSPTNGELRIYATTTSSGSFSIDNISVKEVTDDTNLPRINYEGFSYEETLGDNVVVNGTFDTTNNWTAESGVTFTTSGGIATIISNGSFTGINQSASITFGKTYRVIITHKNTTNAFRVYLGNTSYYTIPTSSEFTTTTFDLVASGTVTNIFILPSTASQTIEVNDISVKEVIGDLPIYGSGKGHFLLEGQSTNLITYSEDFSGYTNSNSTDEANATISPSGVEDATSFLEAATTGQHKLATSISFDGSSTYTFSIYAKTNGRDLYIDTQNSDEWGGRAWFDLTEGTANSVLGSANIQDVGNGWYRCIVTGASTLAGGNLVELLTSNGSSNSTTGDTSKGVYIYGAQLEEGNISSYIPTNGSVVTRAAETCNNAGNADLFDSEGVLYAEIAALANDGTSRIISISDGSFNNLVYLYYYSNNDRIRTLIQSGGVSSFDFNYTLSDVTDFYKFAVRYKANDFSFWINGVQIATDTSGAVPIGLNKLQFTTALGGGGGNFYGKTKMVGVFPYLSNDEMECLTGEGYGTFQAMALANNYTIIQG